MNQIALFKTCRRCGETKPATEFYQDVRYRDGLQSYCIACYRAYQKKWEHSEPNSVPKRRKYHQKWFQKNIERMHAVHNARFRERWHSDAEYRKRKNKQSAIKNNRRQRAINQSGTDYTIEEWQALCAKYDHRCLACGEKKPLTADHVIPLSRGGANSIDNIQPLCKSCNSHKMTKTIDYRK